jgi:hypothetical protein
MDGFFSLITRTQSSVIAALRSAAADEPSDVSVLLDGDLEALLARDKSWLHEFRFGGAWSALHVVVACGWREAAQFLVTDAGLDPRAEAAPFRCSAWDVAALLRDPGHDEPNGIELVSAGSRVQMTAAHWRELTNATFVSRPIATPDYVARLLTGGLDLASPVLTVLTDDALLPDVCVAALAQLRNGVCDCRPGLVIGHCSDEIGNGVFAGCDIPADAYVCCYFGAVVPTGEDEMQRRAKLYAFGMEIFSHDGYVGGSREFHIDGALYRNVAPMINHSRKQTNLRVTWLVWGGVVAALLFTTCHVPTGQQLVYSYGDNWCSLRGIDERELLLDCAPFSSPGWLSELC